MATWIGAGAGAGASISTAAKIAALIAAQVTAHVIGMNRAETRALIEVAKDLGAVKEETDDLARCPNGHLFEKALGACPSCGCEAGEEPSTAELESLDDELERDEDRTAFEEDTVVDADAGDAPGLVEIITRVLIDVGVDDPEALALAIAPAWRDADAPDAAALVGEAQKGGYSVSNDQAAWVVQRVREDAHAVSGAEGRGGTSGRGFGSEPADIRIWFEDGRARWEVENRLAGLDDTGREASINVETRTPMRVRKVLELLREQNARLNALCAVLSERRRDFFLEPDTAKAMTLLQTVPLTQKAVAAAAGIPETALSRWCDYRGRQEKKKKAAPVGSPRARSERTGIEVSTIHGRLPLAAFFSQPARIAPGRTQVAVEDEVQHVLAEGLDESTSREILEHLRDEHDILMAARTLRKHLQAMARMSGPAGADR